MRKLLFILFFNIVFSDFVIAQNIPLDTIKQAMVDFLKTTEQIPDDFNVDNFCNCLISEIKTGKQIDEEQKGIFLFSTFSSYEYLHVLLVDKDSYLIINMRDPFDRNIEKILYFFNTHAEYTRSDIIYYLLEVSNIYNKNLNTKNNHLIYPSN